MWLLKPSHSLPQTDKCCPDAGATADPEAEEAQGVALVEQLVESLNRLKPAGEAVSRPGVLR